MFKLITPCEYDSEEIDREDLIFNTQDYNKEIKSENIFSLTKNENIVHNLILNENKNNIFNDDTGGNKIISQQVYNKNIYMQIINNLNNKTFFVL